MWKHCADESENTPESAAPLGFMECYSEIRLIV